MGAPQLHLQRLARGPLCSTHMLHGTGIFIYICHKFMINVGKYSSPMEHLGYISNKHDTRAQPIPFLQASLPFSILVQTRSHPPWVSLPTKRCDGWIWLYRWWRMGGGSKWNNIYIWENYSDQPAGWSPPNGGYGIPPKCLKNSGLGLPGDSIRDLFIPDRWRSLNHLKGSLNHPKKVTKNCQVIVICPDTWQMWNGQCVKGGCPSRGDDRGNPTKSVDRGYPGFFFMGICWDLHVASCCWDVFLLSQTLFVWYICLHFPPKLPKCWQIYHTYPHIECLGMFLFFVPW